MDTIARIIAAYDEQGIHRTGTDVDNASAEWLAGEIGRLGITPECVPFSLDRVDVLSAFATVDGITYEGLPRFDGPPTGSGGISGRLGPLDSDAEIGLVETRALGDRTVEAARRGSGHRALLNVTLGDPPALTPINADAFTQPFGPPVLQLSNAHRAALERAARREADATVTIETRRTPAQAQNVMARIPGRSRDLAPMVVMTPRSGWWRCASERGGGLVLFLEIMRAVREAGPARDVIFTANSGHELGHLGLDHFIHANPDLVRAAHCWIHLGANFAAAVGPQVRLQASEDALFDQARAAMGTEDVPPDVETPVGTRPRGEARNIFDGRGRYVSLLGGNGLFHHPDDRWPDAVDAEKLARLSRAFCALAIDLAKD
jgi:ribosome modulation factor